MNVGIIGTGLMGAPMALRLLSSGHRVWVYNRTRSRLKPLDLAGAIVCETPLELVRAVEVVIVMVTDCPAIQALLLEGLEPQTSDNPALSGRTIIQMGTIAPAESQALAQRFAQVGASYLEAPVLGSIPEAKNGKLIIMVGAETDLYDRWHPLLANLGQAIYYVGPVGTAAALKLAMNQLIGSLTTAFAQSLALVQRSGLDVDLFMEVLRQSALYAPTFDKKLKRMQTRNFSDPNFPTKHLLKDMGLFIQAAQAVGLDALPAESVRQLVEQALAAGLGEEDYAAVFNVINPE